MGKHIPDSLKGAKSPFLDSLVIRVVPIQNVEELASLSSIKHDEKGLITSLGGVKKFSKTFLIERDKKIQLYFDNDGEDLRPVYASISKEGRMLLEYILLYCLREDKLLCYIDTQDFMDKYFIKSRTTVWGCKKSLVDATFISNTSCQGWYWINPKFMFRGHRSKSKDLESNLKYNKE